MQSPVRIEEGEHDGHHGVEARADFARQAAGVQVHKENSQKRGEQRYVALQTQAKAFAREPCFHEYKPADDPCLSDSDGP